MRRSSLIIQPLIHKNTDFKNKENVFNNLYAEDRTLAGTVVDFRRELYTFQRDDQALGPCLKMSKTRVFSKTSPLRYPPSS